MEVALPRVSGLGARLLPGRLRTVTPKRPVPFPGQRPTFGLPLLFVGDIYTRPERRAWCLESLGLYPFQGSDQVYFFASPPKQACVFACMHAFSPEHRLGSLVPFFQFPASCRLAWWAGGRVVLGVGVELPVR